MCSEGREIREGKKTSEEKMKSESQQSLVYSSCSLLMASLFAYSSSVQLDDPDWYFWFPLYALASAVNLFSIRFASNNNNNLKSLTRLVFCGGIFLFLKVLVEGYRWHGIGGLWSLDMEERVVREKLGSGLVVISMFLQLQPCRNSETSEKGWKEGVTSSCALYGMTALVAVAFGLTFWFFIFVNEIRK